MTYDSKGAQLHTEDAKGAMRDIVEDVMENDIDTINLLVKKNLAKGVAFEDAYRKAKVLVVLTKLHYKNERMKTHGTLQERNERMMRAKAVHGYQHLSNEHRGLIDADS